ncbi:hypothetical protein U9M48_026186 [Paspalum notatum var. saurae]|uniref:DUF1618 domain-containing protein n=1 Tax=Paspalum notatum var. saurae TaxID=547442 RepID=A0AAQ3TWR8_PASNO
MPDSGSEPKALGSLLPPIYLDLISIGLCASQILTGAQVERCRCRRLYYYDSSRSRVANASLHPPIHSDGPDARAAGTMASVLLDRRAYIDGRTNGTTAYSKTMGGHSISVTFWLQRPPRVSCFSVYCPDLNPGDFAREPVIMATEDDLVLLCVTLDTQPIIADAQYDRFHYFIYQAGTPPSLELLNHLGHSSCIFPSSAVGLLRCRTHPELDDSLPTLRSHGSKDNGFYIAATLRYASGMDPGHYHLHTYDSRTKEWATKTALLRQEQELGHHSSHCSTKVIVIGGKAGTMGWIDLNEGILFCDVLLQDHTVPLCHIALPEPLVPDRKLPRDIALIRGRIKYVELQTHVLRPRSAIGGSFIVDGWTAATWSRKATTTKSLEKGSWQPICKVSASQISTDKKKSAQFDELLPKLLDDQGISQPTLERLYTAHPMLSLHQDNLVYFMTKIDPPNGKKAWVLAVDTKKKTLQGVAEVDVPRTLGMLFGYMCSRISEHLHTSPGGITRIKYHLAKIPKSNVIACEKVPTDVYEMLALLTKKNENKEKKAKDRQNARTRPHPYLLCCVLAQ